MAKVYSLQTNFTNGSLSKSAQARTDLAKYGNSADELVNYVITKRGGIIPRAGAVYVAQTKSEDTNIVLIPFIFSTSVAFVIEAGNEYFRFYKDNAQVMDQIVPTDPYEIVTPYAIADMADVKYVQAQNKMIFVHKDYAPRQLVYNYVLETFSFDEILFNYPAMSEQGVAPDCTLTLSSTITGTATLTTDVDTFMETDEGRQIGGGTGLSKIVTYTSAREVTATNLIAYDVDIYSSSEWKLLQSPLCKARPDGKQVGAENVTITCSINSANKAAFRDGGTWSFTDIGKYIRIDEGLCRITAVNGSNTTATVTIERGLTENDDPTKGVPNPAYGGGWQILSDEWNVNDYPSVCGMYENRLILANNPSYPNRVWGSKVGNNYDFFTGIEDADPYEFDLASERFDEVTGINSLKELIIRTVGSEYAVNGANDGPITPTNTSVKRQSSYGSSTLNSAPLENGFAFIQRSKRSVFFYGYDYNIGGFDGDDTSDLNPEVTKNGITSITFEQDPYQHLYCVTSDDDNNPKLAVLCIDRKQEVVGWSEIQGLFYYVTTIPTETTDQTWVLAKINGKMCVCYFDYDVSFDGYTTQETILTDTFTGLDHLADSTVTILLDDQPYYDLYVDATGTLVTPTEGYKLEAGYFFESSCKLLDVELLLDGSVQGRQSSVNRVYVKLYNTQTLDIETARGVDQEIEFRSFGLDVLDQRIEPFTGTKDLSILGAGKNLTYLTLKRKAPLKQHILSVNRMVTVNE
tara:strand:+ start:627 stop:2867 length:2241 start_codon:yes stop_codon:yes gene_type:complete